jgi:O-antigen/teichoic acid export membrane protein
VERPLSPGSGTADAADRGARNLTAMAAGRVATQAVLVLTAFAIPRALGAEGYGLYAAATAVVQILFTAAGVGLPMVELRYLAPLWRGPDRDSALDLGASIWAARLALSLLAGALAVAWLAVAGLALGSATIALVGLFCVARSALEATRELFLPLGHVAPLVAFELLRASAALPAVVFAYPAGGLPAAFAALLAVHAGVLAAAARSLRRVAPLALRRFRWTALAPHLGYSVASFAGTLASIVQAQFAVFALASWVAPREAAFLAFATQLFALVQGLFVAGRRALVPILAELESAGETARLAHWGDVMTRYATAAACALTVAWALLGADVVRLALTPAFLPAHAAGTWMLGGAMLYCWGGSANGLLYVRGRARAASASLVLFAAATIAGLAGTLRLGGDEAAALHIAVVYAGACALFAASSITALARDGLKLPVLRPLALAAPALLAWPASAWQAPLAVRLAAAALFAAAYLGLGAGLGLLPPREMREIARRLRR